jgi:hypothetical protein
MALIPITFQYPSISSHSPAFPLLISLKMTSTQPQCSEPQEGTEENKSRKQQTAKEF